MPSDIYSLWKTNNHGNLNLKLLRATTSEVAKFKKWLILHILTTKKNPHRCLQNCAYMQKCYSNYVYMHGYCSFAFNILLFVSLFFTSLSLLHH